MLFEQKTKTNEHRFKILGTRFVIAAALAAGLGLWALSPKRSDTSFVSKSEISRALSERASHPGLPSEISLEVGMKPVSALVQYSFDPGLQSSMEELFNHYSPDYGALVALDPVTGRILALISYEADQRANAPQGLEEHLALRATFPSASVFKVVTASAAIAEKKFTADTRIAFNGSNHTLYKSHVLKDSWNRWTRTISLREAFAHSVNTVFAKIGAFNVGARGLRDYAGRFGFNRQIASDLPVQPGRALIPEDADAWTLAEAASGFTRDNTMSPLQGALIAATLVNQGKMVNPYAVESVHLQDGEPIYAAVPEAPREVVSPQVASQMLELMRQTVISGTSRKSFRGFSKGRSAQIDVGGKTGSLTGDNPAGKYDWFVGYGSLRGRSIALAALTINRKQWNVKSSYVARRAIETYLTHRPE